MESIWVFGIYHPFISVVCFPYGSTIDERMHCSDCFQYAVQYSHCQHVIYMRTVFIVRYMLCICSACRQDMGKHVCIPATLFRHCRPIWLPYGIHMSVWYIPSIYLCCMLSRWLNNRWTHALFWLFPICSAIFYRQHVIYVRTVLIIRYMLCICSACGQDMGKRVCIPATYIQTLSTDLAAIWKPYECLLHIIYFYLLYAFHMAQK